MTIFIIFLSLFGGVVSYFAANENDNFYYKFNMLYYQIITAGLLLYIIFYKL